MLSKPKKWRNIVEFSNMSNNDEWVFYSDREISREESIINAAKEAGVRLNTGPFMDPHLVLSREVDEREGIRTMYAGSVYDENVSKLTHDIDGFVKFTKSIQVSVDLLKLDPVTALSHWIGYNFYDCMSGGAPLMGLLISRYVIETYDLDLSTQVYGEKDTFESFMAETDHLKDKVEEMAPFLAPRLGSGGGFLPLLPKSLPG